MSNIHQSVRNGNAQNQPDTVVDAARNYMKIRKWKVLPIKSGEKAPTYKDWPTTKTTLADFTPGLNIGVQLGKCSGGLTDVDLDSIETVRLAADFLPGTQAVFGRKSKPRAHYLYVTDLCDTEQKAAIQFKDPTDSSMLVEMRVGGDDKGAQTMFPPSKHPNGERVRWDEHGDPTQVDGVTLKNDVGSLAAAALLGRHYPCSGSRQEAAMALSGTLARAKWSIGRIERFVGAVAKAAGDDESDKRVSCAKSQIEALDKGLHVYGVPKMSELWGQKIIDVAASWLGVGRAGGQVLQADDPVTCAKEFLKQNFWVNGDCALHYYRGNYYRWAGTHYVEIDPDEVRSTLYEFLDGSLTMRVQAIGPFKPTKVKVNTILDALQMGILQPRENEAPFWMSVDENRAASGFIACRNGLLDITTRELLPHSPRLFNVNCLPFDYDPDAPAYPKKWLRFLRQLWPGDEDGKTARFALQEIFGLTLTPDTSYEKIFMVVGPKRAGKGTIIRILTALLGSTSVVNPTFSSLSSNFGLSPLIDKRAAIISDARLGPQTNAHIVAERLLTVSGEDPVTIDRKYRDSWTGRLGVRFLIFTNELPRIADASGALASRFILLMLSKSFYDKEDLELTNKLLTELPGILNWSLRGLDRLRKYGYFEMPKSSHEAIQQLEDLASPISAFIREWCVVEKGRKIRVAKLYDAYVHWCGLEGGKPCGNIMFGRNLSAAFPLLKAKGRGDLRSYPGIGLSDGGAEQYEIQVELKKAKKKG